MSTVARGGIKMGHCWLIIFWSYVAINWRESLFFWFCGSSFGGLWAIEISPATSRKFATTFRQRTNWRKIPGRTHATSHLVTKPLTKDLLIRIPHCLSSTLTIRFADKFYIAAAVAMTPDDDKYLHQTSDCLRTKEMKRGVSLEEWRR